MFQHRRRRALLSLSRLLAFCAADLGLLLSSGWETSSPHHAEGTVIRLSSPLSDVIFAPSALVACPVTLVRLVPVSPTHGQLRLIVSVLRPGQSLQSLADLRASPHFPFSGEVDQAVGGAVESMGPEVVLGAVPLNITGYE